MRYIIQITETCYGVHKFYVSKTIDGRFFMASKRHAKIFLNSKEYCDFLISTKYGDTAEIEKILVVDETDIDDLIKL